MTVTATLELTIATASLADAPRVIRETLQATRAFDGNLGVEVLVDLADETHIVVLERWQSLAHDDAYRAWRATEEGRSSLGSILAGPPTLTRFSTLDEAAER